MRWMLCGNKTWYKTYTDTDLLLHVNSTLVISSQTLQRRPKMHGVRSLITSSMSRMHWICPVMAREPINRLRTGLLYVRRYSTMACECLVPSDVTGLLATPAPFSTANCGEKVTFSEDNSVVERLEPENYRHGGVAYTVSPLPLGQVWQTTVLNTTERNWGFGLVRRVFCFLRRMIIL